MWYIVYREEFSSYTNTGGGYFVKYKSKIEDEYSPNCFEANKYKSIGPAIKRLGLKFNDHITSFDIFLQDNLDYKSYARDSKISDLLGEKSELIFKNGRIEKIGDDGKFIGNANDEVISFIEKLIEKNKKSKEKQDRIVAKALEGCKNYISDGIEGEDFWDGF